jgi:hypothetical protein
MAAVDVTCDLIDFLNASPTAFHAVGTRPVPFPPFCSLVMDMN